MPDPHLHAHCFVFNTTWDQAESAWKAGQFAGLKRDASYFEAAFHSRFARRLGELGLDVTRRKSGWELNGLDAKTLAKFSRRTQQIEDEARLRGILDPAAKSELGAKTRERKQKDLTIPALQKLWDARLTDEEREQFAALVQRIGSDAIPEDQDAARPAMTQALEHCFERKSVVPERTLLAESLKRSVGKASVKTVQHAFGRQELLTADRDGRRMATTRTVLAEEQRMIAFARHGRGTRSPLGNSQRTISREWLNAGQRTAVEYVLGSRDRVMLIRGAAGVGKTAMMQEAVEGLRESGHDVFAFAPSADASRGTLREVGFESADTVARLLVDEKLQAQAAGQVLWIDEAGLLGTRTMTKVFELAERLDARVILSGDRRQHGSVERGAALRLLETDAGLVPAEIKDIQRQRGSYKQAMHALSEGRVEDGFRQLDQLGWIQELRNEDRNQRLANDYVQAVKHGETAIVISPTHREGDQITTEIRAALQREGRLGKEQHVVGQTIRIIGRHLNSELRPNVRLFQGITRHRVPWIQEADESTTMTTADGAVLIERIEW